MSLYSRLAENLMYLSPSYYKQRFFKKLNNISLQNVLERGVEPELIWIREFLPKDAVFFDVGANVGAYIYMLEGHLKPENIYAFEPNPLLFKRLKRLFPKVNISSYALSNKNTKAQFKIPVIKGHSNAARGTLQTELKEEGEKKTITRTVTVKRLDDWAEKNVIDRIDFIKIDVEGNETYTVAGMIDTILRLKPVLMIEIEQRHHKRPIWDYIHYFERYGYNAHYLDRTSFKLVPLTENVCMQQSEYNEKDKQRYINNIIFLPKR
ncbi:methyltransferase FkbM [Elizabethkingia miricola]|uniref:FkbM family methyltransferase n=1 Tax=Elizabethkingia miricola TaxID=172045 RepID=A0ABY3NHV4_ELIMR|nr:FkbM family methyltransferase [Elizabethkingia miricola]OBS14446.1 methyltransferase FkbM [Elizabethkingia miricola]TYO92556.1 FkbM family methyltransferase [Elizabethkingia miricola]